MSINLATPMSSIPRITAPYQKRLEKVGIKTVKDLLFHFPYRYEDFTRVVNIISLLPNESVTVHGTIRKMSVRRSFKTKRFISEAVVEDETGTIKVIWFNQPYLTKTLKAGVKIALAGKPSLDERKRLQFISPEFEIFRAEFLHTSRLVPVYAETRGLSSKWLRWKIYSLMPYVIDEFQEELPEELRKRLTLLPIKDALQTIHFPPSSQSAERARLQFSFTELLKVRLRVLLERELHRKESAPIISFDEPFMQALVKSFGFSLTEDQRKAAWQIMKDIQKPYPMQRLLEGDVGTGKTLVALMVASLAARQGKQVAIMAPTEILASQHFETFTLLLAPFGIPVGIFTRGALKYYDPLVEHIRKLKTSEMREKIASGEIKIIIGTHRLIHAEQGFSNLALVVIDEQHRFGVEQRSHLTSTSGKRPHLLTMSATPIPRSLALTIYGNLHISFLKIFPKGERKIVTQIILPLKRANAYEFVRSSIKQGAQVYVICPVIEESEKLDTKAALEEYEKLKNKVFPEYSVGLLHGRMKSKEKEEAMKQFVERKLNILVATSVVEVGVDAAGASIMIIEGAERFGLSQIHQLRGRIGRRGQVGFCFLFTESRSRTTWARLKALTQSNDGFYLAQKDLEIRGPGELLGKRQAGISDIAMSALGQSEIVASVKREADELVKKSPDLSAWPLLRKSVQEVYKEVHLE